MTAEPDAALITALDAPNAAARRRALGALVASRQGLPEPSVERFNLHLHSFYSFNARGFSPSHLAWEARRQGLYAAALCDFDVLDGLEEFLEAGRRLGLRAAVHLETRAFCRDLADRDINSPGEPGVLYIMGAGFGRLPPDGTPAAAALAGYRRQADARNRALMARIRSEVSEVALDYDRDVASLSPGGCPTERHLVRAYRRRAETVFPEPVARRAFWARRLGLAPDAVAALEADAAAMEERIRARFVKRGGIGYEQPTAATFPPADVFAAWVRACRAMPMMAWLDGTSPGEQDAGMLLDRMAALGVCALNIIPDRNHNVRDPADRARKLACLDAIVRRADDRQLPVNIGTEMNKDGQPFLDDLAGAALRPYLPVFLRGARIVVGQSLLARYTPLAYVGPEAAAEFGTDRRRQNEVFEAVGRLPPLTESRAARLLDAGLERAHAVLRDAARRGTWDAT